MGPMKQLAIFAMILSTSFAFEFHERTSWGLPELEQIILSNNTYVEPHLMDCLKIAYRYLYYGVKHTDTTFPTIKEADMRAVIPSPQRRENWSLEDLMNAAIVIVDDLLSYEKIRFQTSVDKPLLKKEIKLAIKIMSPKGKIKSSSTLINMNILNTLYAVLDDDDENSDIKKGSYRIEMLVVDVSLWNADELHTTIRMQGIKNKLIPFLMTALIGKFNVLDDGETYCLITPVNLLPSSSGEEYIPRSTKVMLSIIREKTMRRLWKSKAFHLN